MMFEAEKKNVTLLKIENDEYHVFYDGEDWRSSMLILIFDGSMKIDGVLFRILELHAEENGARLVITPFDRSATVTL